MNSNQSAFARDMSQNVENASVEESFQKFLNPDPTADDFLIPNRSSLSTNTSLVEDPISSFYTKLLTDRQTDRQT